MRRFAANFIGYTGLQTTVNQNKAKECTGHSHHCHAHQHQRLESTVKGLHLRQCQFVTIVGGVTNILLCGTKISVGASGGCVALVADGFHAFADVFSDFISYITLTLSVKELPRCRFPFGIGRIETTGAVFVAFSLLFGGLVLLFQSVNEYIRGLLFFLSGFFGFAHSSNMLQNNNHGNTGHYDAHNHSNHEDISLHNNNAHSHFQITQIDDAGRVTILWAMVAISVASIIWKEVLFRWTRRVGELASSRVVVANAYHHRADAWSGAVALLGVVGHCVGLPMIDGLAGICVSFSICKIGYGIMRSSVLEFFDYQNVKEVTDVRHELKQYEKCRPINLFLIRHGHSYVLHVSLIVEEHTPTTTIVSAAKELTALARRSVPVTDTYTTFCLFNKQDETSLRDALKMVEAFHGLQSIVYDWENKRLIISNTLPGECMEDIRSVALVFGFDIISANVTCETGGSNSSGGGNNNNELHA